MYPNILSAIDGIKKLSLLSIVLIKDDNTINYFETNGFDELTINDSNGFSPLDYMFIASSYETISYVIDNTPFIVLNNNNIVNALDCLLQRIYMKNNDIDVNKKIIIKLFDYITTEDVSIINKSEEIIDIIMLMIQYLYNDDDNYEEHLNKIMNYFNIFFDNSTIHNKIQAMRLPNKLFYKVEDKITRLMIEKILDSVASFTYDEYMILYETFIMKTSFYDEKSIAVSIAEIFCDSPYSHEIVSKNKLTPISLSLENIKSDNYYYNYDHIKICFDIFHKYILLQYIENIISYLIDCKNKKKPMNGIHEIFMNILLEYDSVPHDLKTVNDD
jgi:hypothetical protein